MNAEIVGVLFFAVIAIAIIIALRSVYIWYTGINEVIKNQNEQIGLMKQQNELIRKLVDKDSKTN